MIQLLGEFCEISVSQSEDMPCVFMPCVTIFWRKNQLKENPEVITHVRKPFTRTTAQTLKTRTRELNLEALFLYVTLVGPNRRLKQHVIPTIM